jgi:putative membrane protein insertion efficiency factor
MRRVAVGALKFYRKYLSAMNLRCCRFYPSCSEYAIEAIHKHGIFAGGVKSAWRVLRCNPFSKGGYDPVE